MLVLVETLFYLKQEIDVKIRADILLHIIRNSGFQDYMGELMPNELSTDIVQNFDIQSSINPSEVIQQLTSFPRKGLSARATNKLRYFEAKSLFIMRKFEEVESICVESLSLAIPERDYYILVKCNVLLSLCYLNMQIDIRIRPCLEIAIEYAIQSEDYELLIHASAFYMNYLRIQREFGPALEEESRIVDLVKRIPPLLTSIEALLKVSQLHLELNKLDKSIQYLRQALVYAQVLKIPNLPLTIVNNLATVYNRIKEYSKSEEILQNGLQVALELEQGQQISLMLLNLGNIKLLEFKYEAALEFYDKCMLEAQKTEFIPPMFLIDIYNNYSMCYWFLNDKDKSIDYLNQAIEIANENRFFNDKIYMEVNKTNHLIDAGEFEETKAILNNASKFYQKGKQYPNLLWVNRSLAHMYTKMNNYKKSYEIYQKIDEISDEYIAELQNKLAAADNGHLKLSELNLGEITTQSPNQARFDVNHGFIGKSKAHQNVLNSALLAAQHQNTSVMISGESGTGKEVIAQFIHKNSIRRNFAFVSVNIAALSTSLIESELFGHTKGAFTGADSHTSGFFLQADKGSIFLDEITEMPYELQSKLLRVIETRKVISVGSSKEIAFDSRIISATNQNLREEMFLNKFRLDLFHRLDTIEILIPPLRERQEDIEPILWHYIDHYAMELKKHKPIVDNSLVDTLIQYSFPGNVREMKNIVERMYILTNKLRWDANLLCSINPFIIASNDEIQLQQSSEEDIILKALIKAKGKQKAAAAFINMSEATLYRRIIKYNLQKYTNKGN